MNKSKFDHCMRSAILHIPCQFLQKSGWVLKNFSQIGRKPVLAQGLTRPECHKKIYTMQTGSISVQTENIFPIIKKFLYSDQEIFLRELISNAVDATSKLQTLSSKGIYKDELGDLTIQIDLDKEAGTLTVRDRGVGMSADEVKKYLNEVAFSSATDFLKKHKDDTNLIGHFGLGFYSAFMVSDKVEVISKTYKKTPKAAHWSCEGNPEYTLTAHKRKERGTRHRPTYQR